MFRKTRESLSESMSNEVFADMSLDDFSKFVQTAAKENIGLIPPWSIFVQALDLYRSGNESGAIAKWQEVIGASDVESRVTLQAWHFLRLAGLMPPPDQAKQVLGVVAEIPVSGGRDLLAAFRDGDIRYYNHAGGAAFVEQNANDVIELAARAWLDVGSTLVGSIGPWDEPALPELKKGDARITMLTPSGPHFGQAPLSVLERDPNAAAFLSRATSLLLPVVEVVKSRR